MVAQGCSTPVHVHVHVHVYVYRCRVWKHMCCERISAAPQCVWIGQRGRVGCGVDQAAGFGEILRQKVAKPNRVGS